MKDNPYVTELDGKKIQLLPDHEQHGKYSHIPEDQRTEEQKIINMGFRIGPVIEY